MIYDIEISDQAEIDLRGIFENGWCFFHAWRNLGFFLCPQYREFKNVSNLTPKCVKSEICKRPSFCYHIVSSRDKPTEP